MFGERDVRAALLERLTPGDLPRRFSFKRDLRMSGIGGRQVITEGMVSWE